ncbi:hypothetical protein BJF79_21245 [Actinomadura sp. CNU-125]|uniref:hypothetical protein n=1 Tax=Actinomadura sp. CNU-125 TaxID=1904961 RepID=UPI000965870D|nr:hypothetical protein [Actinomadura sp. CNU-125]OLT13128.1 hypothetical protein BJF79_21245 [Actinomadura sp. CNU-125]
MSLDGGVGLRAGLRLKSQVCTTEVIVVRAGAGEVRLLCGGVPMVARDAESTGGPAAVPGKTGGSVLGKRYTHPADETLEILVTAAGEGTLGDGDTDLVLKEARPLPASD